MQPKEMNPAPDLSGVICFMFGMLPTLAYCLECLKRQNQARRARFLYNVPPTTEATKPSRKAMRADFGGIRQSSGNVQNQRPAR